MAATISLLCSGHAITKERSNSSSWQGARDWPMGHQHAPVVLPPMEWREWAGVGGVSCPRRRGRVRTVQHRFRAPDRQRSRDHHAVRPGPAQPSAGSRLTYWRFSDPIASDGALSTAFRFTYTVIRKPLVTDRSSGVSPVSPAPRRRRPSSSTRHRREKRAKGAQRLEAKARRTSTSKPDCMLGHVEALRLDVLRRSTFLELRAPLDQRAESAY